MTGAARPPLQLGLVGCGWVSEICHLPALADVAEVNVVAMADTDPERLLRMGDAHGVDRRYQDHRELAADPDVEAVAVCVPAQAHREVSLAALEAGKHLFLEKPLTADLDHSREILELAEARSRVVLVGFNLRWHDLVLEMKDALASGVVDPVESLRSVFSSDTVHKPAIAPWRRRMSLGGGVLIEQAIHHFDLWRFLLGAEVEEVFALSRSGDWDNETATVVARMANGVVVSGLFTEASSNDNELEVFGRNGRLRLSPFRFDGLHHFAVGDDPGRLSTRVRGAATMLQRLPRGVRKVRQGGEFMSSYRNLWRHFSRCVREGEAVGCSLAEARESLRVLLAILASVARGRPVRLAEAPRSVVPI